jgi:exosortase A
MNTHSLWRIYFITWGFLTILLLGVYYPVVGFTVETWIGNQTYSHGFLIPIISAWLIWNQRHKLDAITPSPSLVGVLLFVLIAIGWEFGYQAGAMVVEQYALVAMIVSAALAIFGMPAFRAMAFPLLFLFFAVPFGEALIPAMMNFTADFTTAALRITGIPVYREGNFLSLPSGNWSVVEACSGLRYFVASVTLGVLFAHLSYRSWNRKALFILASIVVPVIANGLRAYMIVMIGHLSDMRLAAGVDHLIYGWLFFGLVMFLLFWAGSFFKEQDRVVPEKRKGVGLGGSHVLGGSFAAVVMVLAIALVLPKALALQLDSRIAAEPPVSGFRAPASNGPWQPAETPLTDWLPHYRGGRAEYQQTYTNGLRSVALYGVFYRKQGVGSSLVTSGNQLVASRDPRWGNVGEKPSSVEIAGQGVIPLKQAVLRSPETRLLVWETYWVDGQWVANPYMTKLLGAKSRLLNGSDDAVLLVVATPINSDEETARGTLSSFLGAMIPGIRSGYARIGETGLADVR